MCLPVLRATATRQLSSAIRRKGQSISHEIHAHSQTRILLRPFSSKACFEQCSRSIDVRVQPLAGLRLQCSRQRCLSSKQGPNGDETKSNTKTQPRQSILSATDKPPITVPQPLPTTTSNKDANSKSTTSVLQNLRTTLTRATPHENIYTIPNLLTFSRLAASPVLGYLVLTNAHIPALALFTYCAITDLLDGWLARAYNQTTVVGTVIDPMADKALMTILTVTLAMRGSLPPWLAVIILGRDVALMISAIYYRYISLPPPKTFSRYWDFSLPSAEVRPTNISKYNTALQLGLIGWLMGMPVLEGLVSAEMVGMLGAGLVGMQYLVAGTTVWSGASYIYSKDAVKILSAEDIEERQRAAKAKVEGKKE